MTEKRFYIDHSGDLWDRQSNDILMTDFGYCEAIYVNAILNLLNDLNDENMMLKGENAHYKLLLTSLKETAMKFCEISKVKE